MPAGFLVQTLFDCQKSTGLVTCVTVYAQIHIYVRCNFSGTPGDSSSRTRFDARATSYTILFLDKITIKANTPSGIADLINNVSFIFFTEIF